MAWTAPRTWTPGELVTALMMNQHVRDNLNFLKTAVDGRFATQTFRGLAMRSVTANLGTSIVTGLTEIVMNDGTRYDGAGFVGKAADLAVAGAGGLDTGSEAASTFYQVYGIAKSSDGTKNLLYHRAKNYFLDESQTVNDTFWEINGGATPTTRQRIAQGFQVDTAGKLEFVDCVIRRVGTAAGQVYFTVEGDSAGNPSGVILATSDLVDCSQLTAGSDQTIRFVFRSPATLAALTQYHLIANVSAAGGASDYISWRATTTNPYARGSVKTYNGSAWANQATNDACFKAYITQNDSALAMPSGYDQYCLIGYVFNDGSSNLWPFVQYEKRFVPLVALSFATALAVPELIPLNLPPAPIAVVLGTANFTGSTFSGAAGVPDGQGMAFGSARRGGSSFVYLPISSASPTGYHDEVFTDYPALYLISNAGTATFWISSWRW